MSKFNDPHVVSLTYSLNQVPVYRFDSPPPIEITKPAFKLRLSEGLLMIELLDHYTTEESARLAVEPYLKAWEIHSALAVNRTLLSFEFIRSEIVDRNPLPQTGSVATVECVGMVVAVGEVSVTVTKSQYPSPPTSFAASDEVKLMWARYIGYRDGKEHLLSMAYACLTCLERTTGKKKGARQAVCTKYALHQDVRDKLGDLVSQHGSPEEARKLDHEAKMVPLTGAERDWIERVIRALIQRKAEYDADPTATFPEITLADFPAI